MAMDANKQKALDMAIKQIDKTFGKGTLMRLGDKEFEPIESISTGSLGLDMALGIGGIPQGRIIEIYGPESSGKTTLALQTIASAQKKGMVCAFIDAEHALDVVYARNLGVDTDNLLVSQPDFGEQALDVLETLTRSGAVDLIIVDSVAALTPKSEIEGDMGDSHVGLQARLMSQALRKLTAILHKTNTTVIFINQIRMKIGVMFGNPETTSGGRALKFYASVRLDIRRIDLLGPILEARFDRCRDLGFDALEPELEIDVAVRWFEEDGKAVNTLADLEAAQQVDVDPARTAGVAIQHGERTVGLAEMVQHQQGAADIGDADQ